MRYIKADQVMPEKLLREVQKYVNGELIYIPKRPDDRKKWGEKTGAREYLSQRNNEIRRKFSAGTSIDELTDIFCLSHDSIKKIVYSKNVK